MISEIRDDSKLEELISWLELLGIDCEGELQATLSDVFVDLHIYESSTIYFDKLQRISNICFSRSEGGREVVIRKLKFESKLKNLPYGKQTLSVKLEIKDGTCCLLNAA